MILSGQEIQARLNRDIIIDPFDPPSPELGPVPVPLPSAAWGGLVLLTVLALNRLRRMARRAA